MPATWIIPSRAATWWHWATASDSIQLRSEANTLTVADPARGADSGRDFCWDKDALFCGEELRADGVTAAEAAWVARSKVSAAQGTARQNVMRPPSRNPPPAAT
ncbi:hypothetical protein Pen02_31200 [Plantactinospora endophytica]|uniref:Uncharacterized protein n=1 Tax=Plantactinospora endophytica TaxID=673535 RepID=A0ABQ4E0C5_9ACTN|nr:hypothetical protein Pen02_31200 [Plantactinospora endophytica]